MVTDGCIPVQYWQDSDGDSHGDRDATSIRACTPPAGYSTDNLDCNDACATCHPGGMEICDALDNNCDASVDEGLLVTLFRDADTDSFGSTESMSLCPGAVGWVEVGGDCNDTNDAVSPSSTETCNVTHQRSHDDSTPRRIQLHPRCHAESKTSWMRASA